MLETRKALIDPRIGRAVFGIKMAAHGKPPAPRFRFATEGAADVPVGKSHQPQNI
jgi:hypothetical protein